MSQDLPWGWERTHRGSWTQSGQGLVPQAPELHLGKPRRGCTHPPTTKGTERASHPPRKAQKAARANRRLHPTSDTLSSLSNRPPRALGLY